MKVQNNVKVGILAVQGAFAEHEYSLQKAQEFLKEQKTFNLEVVEVKKPCDLETLDGLILPGGETTTMSIFLQRNNFQETLAHWMQGNGSRKPKLWGTCAGLILLSNKVEEQKKGGQLTIGGIDITSTRNAYGRQFESFESVLDLHTDIAKISEKGKKCYKGVFIRAPGIKSVDREDIKILASYEKDGNTKIVAVQDGPIMATTFHPELTEDHRWHIYFLDMILKSFTEECVTK